MVNEIQVKSMLNKHKKRDEWFLDDYSLNPYEACSFNCIFCYIRGSKYGENMEKNLAIKINAPDILEKQLKRRAEKREYGIIAISSATESWMQIEEKQKLTRRLLEIILKYRFPIRVITKSKLVLRDLDLLKNIDKKAILPQDLKDNLKHGVVISFSLSTLNVELAKIFEPLAPTPKERLETMKKCKEEGFYTGVNNIPVLPYLSDSEEEIEKMIRTAKEYGANFVLVGGLTLFGKGDTDSKVLFYKMLERYYPQLIPKYKSLYRIFFMPPKEYQNRLQDISKKLCYKYGLKHRTI